MSATVLNAMVFKHTKFPNAAKDYLRFMMEAPQYDPWLTACLGYWSAAAQGLCPERRCGTPTRS